MTILNSAQEMVELSKASVPCIVDQLLHKVMVRIDKAARDGERVTIVWDYEGSRDVLESLAARLDSMGYYTEPYLMYDTLFQGYFISWYSK